MGRRSGEEEKPRLIFCKGGLDNLGARELSMYRGEGTVACIIGLRNKKCFGKKRKKISEC